ncbi:BORG2 protein, partial [Sula dactylatra]|nr:BORG2 protein [Sula dactylatra]
MPAKTPIYLKAANNKKGKKFKLRDILSPDMISPPLGDFRHTIHIGKEGQHDVFGDISFLQGNYELLPGNEGETRVSHCEPVIEEKLQEKNKQMEDGETYKDDIWEQNGGSSHFTNGRDSHSSSFSERCTDWQTVDFFDDSQLACELTKTKTKSEESLSDLAGSLLSLQLDLGPSLLDE